MNTMTVSPIVVVKSKNPYTVCVTGESSGDCTRVATGSGFSYTRSGLTYTGPGGESAAASPIIATETLLNDRDIKTQRDRVARPLPVRVFKQRNDL